ncbi:zinc finger, CCHC-type containing protein [Tanacetum coccineum]
MFEEQAKQELFETVKAFHACKQEDGQSHGKTIAELHVMLKLHEKGIPKKAETLGILAIREGKIEKDKKKPQGEKGKDKGKNKLAYAPKPKIPPPLKRDNPAKDSVCHHYKEVGHWKRNCPSYQVVLKKRKNDSIACTSGIFTIELYVFPNKTWVYDMGCDTHICNTSQGLRGSNKLKHGALSLYVGNGMRASIEAIGSFDLVLPSGLIIVLDNCHFAPNITSLTTLLKSFWGYALESVVRILNMVLTKKVERTPYEIWYGKAPKLSYLRVWGCEALVKRDTLDKLDPRSIKCIFIGYPMIGYYFYYPLENKISVAQNAEFFENILMVQEASGSHGLLESSGSDKGLELIQEEDTQPSENTSEIHNEVAPIEVETQNVKVPIRRSARIPHASYRYGFYVDVEEYELGDLNEPPNYNAALLDLESDKWLEAMNTEMQSMKDN